MRVFDINGSKVSFSVESGVKYFVGWRGKDESRTYVSVTMWEHFNSETPYQNIIPRATGYSFCMPEDDFNMRRGLKQATTKLLEQIGFSNRTPFAREVHKLMKDYIYETE